MPGVIHIKQGSLLLRHRPWHTMLRASVTDHSMRKYCTGVYKHMPARFEAHLSFFTAAPEAVSKLGHKTARATRQALTAGSAAGALLPLTMVSSFLVIIVCVSIPHTVTYLTK